MSKIVVVGSINVDLVFITETRPKPGETLFGQDFTVNPGGKGANQAVAASRLGSDVSMIGCVGKDNNSEFAIKNLKSQTVNCEGIKVVDDVPTGVAGIIVSQSDNSIIVISGANNKVDESVIDDNIELIKSADLVVMQLEIPVETNEYLANICYNNNIKTILNPAPAMKLSNDLIDKISYLTPNEHECRIIFGEDENSSIEDIVKKYKDKLIVTMGKDGAIFADINGVHKVPAKLVETVDTTGAGDTFNGALANMIVEGNSLIDSVKFAVNVASLSVTKKGAQGGMPRKEDMLFL